ncbi:MAG: DUF2007 domain-containing protein [Cytophagia bacterium]|nr:DUF2007 domain-containing protein [Cytophagia bacterium]
MKFVTIKSSHNEVDLLPLKGLLESEGITCFLKNQFTNQIMSHMATFQVELQVADSDLEKVAEIMNSTGESA